MSPWKIKEDIIFIGVRHWDRRLFDELIPLPDGTSYNSYLVLGTEKVALIDTADPSRREEFFRQLEQTGAKRIDYVISNHAEQDHSGLIPDVLEAFPEAKVVTNEKNKGFLMDLLRIPGDRFMVVADGEEISLGEKTLKFIFTPWVHWPETMVTYLKEDKILFTCDFFGSHLATSDLFADEGTVCESAKRYYAEIMMPFRGVIARNIEKIRAYDFDIIAPSHGPLYKNPEFIIKAYEDWISDRVEKVVLVPYVSMHGSTRVMVEYFVGYLMGKGVKVIPFNLAVTDIGKLAIELVDAAAVVLGSPTVLTGLHPSAVYALYLLNALRPKTRFLSIIGSYGWGGKAVDVAKSLLGNLKAELLEPVLIKGYPTEEAFGKLKKLADNIISRFDTL